MWPRIRGSGGGMGLLACGSRHRAAEVQEVSELTGITSTNDNITVDAVAELHDPPKNDASLRRLGNDRG